MGAVMPRPRSPRRLRDARDEGGLPSGVGARAAVKRRAARRRWRTRLVAVVIIALTVWLAYEVWTWPRVAPLERTDPRTTAFMTRYAAQQRAAGRDARVSHTWVPYGAISPHLKRAVLVAE